MLEKKSSRTRNWSFILYPESAPVDWQSMIDELHIEYAISPLHDKDINPDGEPKKAHFHVVLCFASVKTYEQVKQITDLLNATIPQVCNSLRGSIEYFWHKNNPEKYQYNKADVKCGGGLDLETVLKPTCTERHAIIQEMMLYVSEHDIVELFDLINYAMTNEPDWFSCLCDSSTVIMNAYIKSNRHRQRRE